VSIEHSPGLVAADGHRYSLRHAGAHHVADSCAPQRKLHRPLGAYMSWRLNSQVLRFELHDNRRCTGSAPLAPRSLPARVNMDRVAVSVVLQSDLLDRRV